MPDAPTAQLTFVQESAAQRLVEWWIGLNSVAVPSGAIANTSRPAVVRSPTWPELRPRATSVPPEPSGLNAFTNLLHCQIRLATRRSAHAICARWDGRGAS